MEANEINKVLKNGKTMLIITLVFLVITLGVVGYALYLRWEETKNPQDLGELISNSEEKKSQYVKLNIAYVPYVFAEDDGEKNENYYYFAMDKDKYMYIVKLSKATYEKIEGMYSEENETFDYELKGYTFDVPTKLRKLAIEAANEVFEEKVLTTSNFRDYFGSVYVDEIQKAENETINNMYGVAVLSGMFTVIFGIMFIVQKVNSSRITKNQELMEELKAELENLVDNPYKKYKTYLTDNYIICRSSGLDAIAYRDVIWEYPLIRYQNGIAVGKTLILFTKNKDKHTLTQSGANDTIIDEIMVEIKDKNDNVRIGYTKENREFYRNYQKEAK